ncbi:ABC transporter permease (plasmid) [Halococcus dombrowskii]|uniref:ABC transporter permease n=1 Tax=Halococcus dombrowskii TaxID=179637 RepID=A0AAV3SI23_HALDO|nr:ABC transporter permease [Halococcus dombrowskii]UOO97267.1 ABC transporter permease [Halococcus dombrowskii]
MNREVTTRRIVVGALVIVAVAGLWLLLTNLFDVPLDGIFTIGFVGRLLQAATPIALAAIGGLFAEKSGVFNIGLEGFMIIGAITAAVITFILGGSSATQGDLWIAMAVTVVISIVLAAVFAVLLIRYRANQIVAGLAVWFIGLGFAPFTANLLWGSVNSPGLVRINAIRAPYLTEMPILGPTLFAQSPLVLLTILIVIVSWVVLYRTRYGYWIQAAGENPEALDTAGIDVNHVRYAAVICSGALAGFGGAVLLANAGTFVGTGDTMVNGRGWIGIVAYLFGNYNPLGAGAAALLFGALDMLQVQFQAVGIDAPNRLIGLFPYVVVVAVLTVWGRTQVPSSVGEPYESED